MNVICRELEPDRFSVGLYTKSGIWLEACEHDERSIAEECVVALNIDRNEPEPSALPITRCPDCLRLEGTGHLMGCSRTQVTAFPTIGLDDLPAVGAVGVTKPNDPAFARSAGGEDAGALGLSKREYFAGEAMKGFLANPALHDDYASVTKGDFLECVRAADSLIDALNFPQNKAAGASQQ